MRRATEADGAIGNRVRARRKELGLSQDRLGQQLGITFQQIQKYENGTNRIGSSRLAEMSKILAVPISYFFEDLDRQSPEQAPSPGVLHVEGAHELLGAYARIGDPGLRKAVVTLARTLARIKEPARSDEGPVLRRSSDPSVRAPAGAAAAGEPTIPGRELATENPTLRLPRDR